MGDNEHRDPEEPTVHAIESLEDYLRRYGLPAVDEGGIGEFNGLTRNEALDRIRAENDYRDSVIQRHQSTVKSDGDSLSSSNQENSLPFEIEDKDAIIIVLLENQSTHSASLYPLASFCDTVRRMVKSRSRFGVKTDSSSDTDPPGEIEENIDLKGERDAVLMKLSLVEFDSGAVMEFLGALECLRDLQVNGADEGNSIKKEDNSESNRKRRFGDQDANVLTAQRLIDDQKISVENIVECLKIAHYLQCYILLEGLTSIVESSVDAKNCMSICALADALNLQSLFEASVNYVIGRLDALQGTGDEEEKVRSSEDDEIEDVWVCLPHELRNRVLTMRNVMRSSVIGRGSKVSGLFFSSGFEFLSIFKETIRDQRERLAEARERREEVIRERKEEWETRRQRRGRWFDASFEAEKSFVYGGDVAYALEKIEKQEQRLRTLERFYEEQKIIFKTSEGSNKEIIL